jgi:hypothetical protein
MTHERNYRLADILIGGNHLASSLVHTLGSDFYERFPPDANAAAVRDAICNRVDGVIGTSAAWIVVYDIWVAWAAIMRFPTSGERTEPALRKTEVEPNSSPGEEK